MSNFDEWAVAGELSNLSYTHDYRHRLTNTRQKENGYEGSIPSTQEDRAKRFFANGK